MSQDFEDYWNEYKIIQETRQLDSYLDEECPPEQEFAATHLPEGAVEADWLSSAGLSFLTESFENGCEVPDSELEPAIRHLSTRQADAVRLRVHSLNHTVRQRGRQLKARHKKPDIRDVFRDFEVSLYIFTVKNNTGDMFNRYSTLLVIFIIWDNEIIMGFH